MTCNELLPQVEITNVFFQNMGGMGDPMPVGKNEALDDNKSTTTWTMSISHDDFIDLDDSALFDMFSYSQLLKAAGELSSEFWKVKFFITADPIRYKLAVSMIDLIKAYQLYDYGNMQAPPAEVIKKAISIGPIDLVSDGGPAPSHSPGDVWKVGDDFAAMAPNGQTKLFNSASEAKNYAGGKQGGEGAGAGADGGPAGSNVGGGPGGNNPGQVAKNKALQTIKTCLFMLDPTTSQPKNAEPGQGLGHEPGQVWKIGDGKWAAKSPKPQSTTKEFDDEWGAKQYAKGNYPTPPGKDIKCPAGKKSDSDGNYCIPANVSLYGDCGNGIYCPDGFGCKGSNIEATHCVKLGADGKPIVESKGKISEAQKYDSDLIEALLNNKKQLLGMEDGSRWITKLQDIPVDPKNTLHTDAKGYYLETLQSIQFMFSEGEHLNPWDIGYVPGSGPPKIKNLYLIMVPNVEYRENGELVFTVRDFFHTKLVEDYDIAPSQAAIKNIALVGTTDGFMDNLGPAMEPHSHTYTVDTSGNGVALEKCKPENLNICHSHGIVNGEVQIAASSCYPNCVKIFGDTGIEPHTHMLTEPNADEEAIISITQQSELTARYIPLTEDQINFDPAGEVWGKSLPEGEVNLMEFAKTKELEESLAGAVGKVFSKKAKLALGIGEFTGDWISSQLLLSYHKAGSLKDSPLKINGFFFVDLDALLHYIWGFAGDLPKAFYPEMFAQPQIYKVFGDGTKEPLSMLAPWSGPQSMLIPNAPNVQLYQFSDTVSTRPFTYHVEVDWKDPLYLVLKAAMLGKAAPQVGYPGVVGLVQLKKEMDDLYRGIFGSLEDVPLVKAAGANLQKGTTTTLAAKIKAQQIQWITTLGSTFKQSGNTSPNKDMFKKISEGYLSILKIFGIKLPAGTVPLKLSSPSDLLSLRAAINSLIPSVEQCAKLKGYNINADSQVSASNAIHTADAKKIKIYKFTKRFQVITKFDTSVFYDFLFADDSQTPTVNEDFSWIDNYELQDRFTAEAKHIANISAGAFMGALEGDDVQPFLTAASIHIENQRQSLVDIQKVLIRAYVEKETPEIDTANLATPTLKLLASLGATIDETQFKSAANPKQKFKNQYAKKTAEALWKAQKLNEGKRVKVEQGLYEALAKNRINAGTLVPDIEVALQKLQAMTPKNSPVDKTTPAWAPQITAAQWKADPGGGLGGDADPYEWLVKLMQVYTVMYLKDFKNLDITQPVWAPLTSADAPQFGGMNPILCKIVLTPGFGAGAAGGGAPHLDGALGAQGPQIGFKPVPINNSFNIMDQYFMLKSA